MHLVCPNGHEVMFFDYTLQPYRCEELAYDGALHVDDHGNVQEEDSLDGPVEPEVRDAAEADIADGDLPGCPECGELAIDEDA